MTSIAATANALNRMIMKKYFHTTHNFLTVLASNEKPAWQAMCGQASCRWGYRRTVKDTTSLQPPDELAFDCASHLADKHAGEYLQFVAPGSSQTPSLGKTNMLPSAGFTDLELMNQFFTVVYYKTPQVNGATMEANCNLCNWRHQSLQGAHATLAEFECGRHARGQHLNEVVAAFTKQNTPTTQAQVPQPVTSHATYRGLRVPDFMSVESFKEWELTVTSGGPKAVHTSCGYNTIAYTGDMFYMLVIDIATHMLRGCNA